MESLKNDIYIYNIFSQNMQTKISFNLISQYGFLSK